MDLSSEGGATVLSMQITGMHTIALMEATIQDHNDLNLRIKKIVLSVLGLSFCYLSFLAYNLF